MVFTILECLKHSRMRMNVWFIITETTDTESYGVMTISECLREEILLLVSWKIWESDHEAASCAFLLATGGRHDWECDERADDPTEAEHPLDRLHLIFGLLYQRKNKKNVAEMKNMMMVMRKKKKNVAKYHKKPHWKSWYLDTQNWKSIKIICINKHFPWSSSQHSLNLHG